MHSTFKQNFLYEKVLNEPENKVCFDCNSIDEDELPWTSASHGVFICHRCAVIHLTLSLSPGSSFGSYPKIFLRDLWTPEELRKLSLGGNKRARVFFEQHGWTGRTNIEEKHTSRAAKLYRQLLSEDAEFTIAKEKGLLPAPFDDDINANEALNDGFAEKDNDNGTSIKKLVDAVMHILVGLVGPSSLKRQLKISRYLMRMLKIIRIRSLPMFPTLEDVFAAFFLYELLVHCFLWWLILG